MNDIYYLFTAQKYTIGKKMQKKIEKVKTENKKVVNHCSRSIALAH